jgi:hypothetical protein
MAPLASRRPGTNPSDRLTHMLAVDGSGGPPSTIRVTGRLAGTFSAFQRPSEALLLADGVVVLSSKPRRIIWELKNVGRTFKDKGSPEVARGREFVELCNGRREKLKKPSGSVSSLPT